MSGISYQKIVFGLKHHQRLYDCRTFIELVHLHRIIISEHNSVNDDCERPGLHYHGVIEQGKDNYLEVVNAVALLGTYCAYFSIEECENPEQFIIELAQPPKKIVVIEVANSYNLRTYYDNTSVLGIRLELTNYEKEVSKMETIKFIISNILSRGSINPTEIREEINNFNWYTPDQLETLVNHSIELVHQKSLDQSILELCGNFKGVSENYYTIKESVELVVEWCQHQNIIVEEFIMNLVNCLNRQVSYKNTLFFQGSCDSGMLNIIHSIEEACKFIGKIKSESTGYTYVWEECLEKRCIIMQDPVFHSHLFEELENILRGVGTCVPHRQSVLKYLHPTPVVVICSKIEEINNSYLQRLQNSFLESYVNLKPFWKTIIDPRRLHPDWVNVLYLYYTEKKIVYTASCCEDATERFVNSDSSCKTAERIGINSPVESISSATPFAGCSSDPCH